LLLLIEANGELVDREHFFARLWPGVAVTEASLNQCIAKLRRDLHDPPEGGVIETVPRRGYRLSAALEKAALPAITDRAPEQPSSAPSSSFVGLRRIAYVLAILVMMALASYGWFRRSRRLEALSLVTHGFRLIRGNNTPAGFGDASSLFRQAL